MPDDQDQQPPAEQQPGADAPDFLDQVIARSVAALREQAPDLFRAAGDPAEAVAANSARVALWLAGLRPGGLRVLRLLSGYEVELTPQDPLGFLQHLGSALVGETMTNHPTETAEDAAKALSMEIANLTNQVTADLAPFIIRTLLWSQCAAPLQQALAERAEQQELAARRGSGKREEPAATPTAPSGPPASPPEVAARPQPAQPEPAAEPPAPPRPRLIRPGEPEDDGPPPPLIFPGRR